MTKLNIQRVASRMAERLSHVTASVHDYQVFDEGCLARVVVSFNTKQPTAAEVATTVSNLFGNELSIVPGSFRRLNPETAIASLMVGFVTANRAVRPYDEKAGNYMVMASNILMDKTDESLWELRDSNGIKTLCRQGDEDLSELLEQAKVRRLGTPTLAAMASTVNPDEFVAYIGRNHDIRHGYVLSEAETEGDEFEDEVKILSLEGQEEEQIESARVIEVAHLNGADRFEEVSATGKELKDYYKQLYGHNPEFFKKLSSIIDQHAVA